VHVLECLHVHEERLVVHVERGEHGGHWGNAHVGEGEVQGFLAQEERQRGGGVEVSLCVVLEGEDILPGEPVDEGRGDEGEHSYQGRERHHQTETGTQVINDDRLQRDTNQCGAERKTFDEFDLRCKDPFVDFLPISTTNFYRLFLLVYFFDSIQRGTMDFTSISAERRQYTGPSLADVTEGGSEEGGGGEAKRGGSF